MNNQVVQVNKEEAMEIRKQFKHASVYKTMKQAGHHKFWTEETSEILAFLKNYRNRNVVEHWE
jgi:hypothetical protein